MTPVRPLALITGGARRVGRAICLELANAGCDIHFTHLNSRADAVQVCAALELLGVRATTSLLDLDDPAAVERFTLEFIARHPRLDVLVHSAAIYESSGTTGVTADAVLRHYRINALAPLLLTARLGAILAESQLPGGGSVIAFSDIHSLGRPRKQHAAYSMSKAALTEMVQTLAIELAPRVRVNAIAPGVIAFPETGPESDPDIQARYLKRVPLARSGTPEDAAKAVRWLALEANYITGEIIRLDGGRWLA
ncbi:MAG TPA: SDR family oxidoreductase [Phycisphaerales bacterium]|nr:SDR family oxidoreductase [Phycisphaerales bacterium]